MFPCVSPPSLFWHISYTNSRLHCCCPFDLREGEENPTQMILVLCSGSLVTAHTAVCLPPASCYPDVSSGTSPLVLAHPWSCSPYSLWGSGAVLGAGQIVAKLLLQSVACCLSTERVLSHLPLSSDTRTRPDQINLAGWLKESIAYGTVVKMWIPLAQYLLDAKTAWGIRAARKDMVSKLIERH